MKATTLLLVMMLILSSACNKNDDDPKSEIIKTTINGETFVPTDSSITKTGKSLVLIFSQGSKKVEITTNDTIAGSYTVSSSSLKEASPLLKATIVYADGTKTYNGNTGTVTIVKNAEGTISGTYNAKVISSENISIEISAGTFSKIQPVKVFVLIESATAIADSLTVCYTNLNRYTEFSFLFDAVYSNSTAAPNSSWSAIYGHTQNPLNDKVLLLWSKSYDVIFKANLIIKSAEKVITDEAAQKTITSQAKTIRAYAYLNLLNWFGGVPLEDSTADSKSSRNTAAEVTAFIKSDLLEAIDNLPASWSANEKFRVNKYFALGLLSRLHISSNSYNDAQNTSQQIIASAAYALSLDTINFKENSSEIFLGFNKGTNTEFNTFFTKSSYVPALRFTELLLISAKASFNLGNTMDALQRINMLRARRNKPGLTSVNADDIFQQWKVELKHEGTSFITLKQFGRAVSEFQIQEYKLLMPVPMQVLDTNSNIYQNPGY